MIEFKNYKTYADSPAAEKAAGIFCEEISIRTGKAPEAAANEADAAFVFRTVAEMKKDDYSLRICNGTCEFEASGIRGFIFSIGMFLRKCVKSGDSLALCEDITGFYSPDKRIRGHQIGYRTTPNTYDAWSYDDYRRYYLDMMFFGTNTVEHIPYERGVSKRNRLMKYDEEEFIAEAARMADEYDLDVSVWHPNNDGETVDEAAERRKKLYSTMPRLDVVFPPGGDPGDFEADEFVERCKAISKALKEVHPNAQMWPSAQQPHSVPTWGVDFIEELEKLPDEIDGVIMGPNHAFPLDVLRRKVPSKYPIRLYPDITHNVRCEYPVHFDRDDWHFALTTGLSRECTNPRPREYRHIHRLTRGYVVGSVSYSEGVTDDVNKMVWADMDFFPDCELRTSLLDYCRLFFYGADCEKLADAIFALELNWQCDPAENAMIEPTLRMYKELAADYPFLNSNWRFLQLLLRAKCDWVLRTRRIFELGLIKSAKREITNGNLAKAEEILNSGFSAEYINERNDITALAKTLFDLIGLQMDIENYCADNWERGAILETIDLPITDRKWLLLKLEAAKQKTDPVAFMQRIVNRNKIDGDEYYFSVALNGLEECGAAQSGEIYMNFQGDRPNVNTGEMPVCMFKVFDNLTFKAKIGGLTADCDYRLRVTYQDKKMPLLNSHTITVNGKIIYKGAQFGGESDPEFDADMLSPGFVTASYVIPKNAICNGCIDLEMSEPVMGVIFSEFSITKIK